MVIFLKLGRKYSYKHSITETFVEEFKGKGLCSIIARLVFCSGIYYIWHFMNELTFYEGSFSKLELLKAAELEVKLNLDGRGIKDKDSVENRRVADFWDVQFLNA